MEQAEVTREINPETGKPRGWHKPEKQDTLADVFNKISELEKQLDALRTKAREIQQAERMEAIAQAKNIMAAHGLTVHDLGIRGHAAATTGKKSPMAGSKAPIKYRDKDTGNVWTGRGLQPKWLKAQLAAGKKLEDFAV